LKLARLSPAITQGGDLGHECHQPWPRKGTVREALRVHFEDVDQIIFDGRWTFIRPTTFSASAIFFVCTSISAMTGAFSE
jgi:hypothetical protein